MEATGVYFSSVRDEVIARVSPEDKLPEGIDWQLVSDEAGLGLLAVRRLLTARKLTTQPDAIYWYGLTRTARRVQGLPAAMKQEAPERAA